MVCWIFQNNFCSGSGISITSVVNNCVLFYCLIRSKKCFQCYFQVSAQLGTFSISLFPPHSSSKLPLLNHSLYIVYFKTDDTWVLVPTSLFLYRFSKYRTFSCDRSFSNISPSIFPSETDYNSFFHAAIVHIGALLILSRELFALIALWRPHPIHEFQLAKSHYCNPLILSCNAIMMRSANALQRCSWNISAKS